MKSLVALYRHHIYGIIGTLIFHILLVLFFLFTEVRHKTEIKETAMEIEIPIELIEDVMDLLSANQKTDGPDAENTQPEGESFQGSTNLAANRGTLAASDRFFDETYNREIAAAKELAREVNDQLSKEILDMESIQMPEDITEGKKEEEISNVIYTGQSNIEYQLENRFHLRLPIPVYMAKGGGVVIVDVSVNREGRVVSAKPRQSPSVKDEQIYFYSRIAALKTIFNSDATAPALQNGTIRYTFIAQ